MYDLCRADLNPAFCLIFLNIIIIDRLFSTVVIYELFLSKSLYCLYHCFVSYFQILMTFYLSKNRSKIYRSYFIYESNLNKNYPMV